MPGQEYLRFHHQAESLADRPVTTITWFVFIPVRLVQTFTHRSNGIWQT